MIINGKIITLTASETNSEKVEPIIQPQGEEMIFGHFSYCISVQAAKQSAFCILFDTKSKSGITLDTAILSMVGFIKFTRFISFARFNCL